MALETASSMIRDGRIDAAIIGATCVYLNSIYSIEFLSMGALSPDGICRKFNTEGGALLTQDSDIVSNYG